MSNRPQPNSPPTSTDHAPLRELKPMPFAKRVKAIELGCRDLGIREGEVLAEVRGLVVESYYRHCKRSPSASITIMQHGWEATFLDNEVDGAVPDRGAVLSFLNLERDTDSMTLAEREAIRCERIALTIAATLDHPEAVRRAPWPRVMSRPVPGPRSWVTYQEALNAFYGNHLPKTLVPYIRAAGVVLDTLYGGADARPLHLLSRKTPRVARIEDSLAWLRERSAISGSSGAAVATLTELRAVYREASGHEMTDKVWRGMRKRAGIEPRGNAKNPDFTHEEVRRLGAHAVGNNRDAICAAFHKLADDLEQGK